MADDLQPLFAHFQTIIGIRPAADAAAADGQFDATGVEQVEQAHAGVLDDLDPQLGLRRTQARHRGDQPGHGAHDHPHRQATAFALENAEHFFAQMGKVALDQPRIADHAAAQVIGLQALVGAQEEGGAQGALDLVQGLGGAGLRDGDAFGGLVQRAFLVEGDQQAQLPQAQTRGDGAQGWQHGNNRWLSWDRELSLGRPHGAE